MYAALPFLVLLAQAEPAPEPPSAPPPPAAPAVEPPPAVALPAPVVPPSAIGVAVGLGYRLAPTGQDVPPSLGFAISALASYRYLLVGERLALGVSATFAYDQYKTTVHFTPTVGPGVVPTTVEGTRELSFGDFVALQTVALLLGRARPWLGVGAGISLDHFTSPETAYAPGEERSTLVVLQGSAGLDIDVASDTDLVLRADLPVPLGHPTLDTVSGSHVRIFGPRLAARLGFQFRF